MICTKRAADSMASFSFPTSRASRTWEHCRRCTNGRSVERLRCLHRDHQRQWHRAKPIEFRGRSDRGSSHFERVDWLRGNVLLQPRQPGVFREVRCRCRYRPTRTRPQVTGWRPCGWRISGPSRSRGVGLLLGCAQRQPELDRHHDKTGLHLRGGHDWGLVPHVACV
jgi:hypothetical protein